MHGLPGRATLDLLQRRWAGTCASDAQGGTDFMIFGGEEILGNRRLIERLETNGPRYFADVLVVDADWDDGHRPVELVETEVVASWEEAHCFWPTAQIVAIVPQYFGLRPGQGSFGVRLEAILRNAVALYWHCHRPPGGERCSQGRRSICRS